MAEFTETTLDAIYQNLAGGRIGDAGRLLDGIQSLPPRNPFAPKNKKALDSLRKHLIESESLQRELAAMLDSDHEPHRDLAMFCALDQKTFPIDGLLAPFKLALEKMRRNSIPHPDIRDLTDVRAGKRIAVLTMFRQQLGLLAKSNEALLERTKALSAVAWRFPTLEFYRLCSEIMSLENYSEISPPERFAEFIRMVISNDNPELLKSCAPLDSIKYGDFANTYWGEFNEQLRHGHHYFALAMARDFGDHLMRGRKLEEALKTIGDLEKALGETRTSALGEQILMRLVLKRFHKTYEGEIWDEGIPDYAFLNPEPHVRKMWSDFCDHPLRRGRPLEYFAGSAKGLCSSLPGGGGDATALRMRDWNVVRCILMLKILDSFLATRERNEFDFDGVEGRFIDLPSVLRLYYRIPWRDDLPAHFDEFCKVYESWKEAETSKA